MVPNADEEETEASETSSVTAYEDGDYFVIRDEDNPEAWIRSDLVRPLGD